MRTASRPRASGNALSALAEATSSIRLGTLVLCTAFRNPAVLGPLRGSRAHHRVTAAHRKSAIRRPLLLGPRRRTPPARGAAGRPAPLIGGTGPRMLRATARHADLWNNCWFGDPAGFAPAVHTVREACAAAGRDPARHRRGERRTDRPRGPDGPRAARPHRHPRRPGRRLHRLPRPRRRPPRLRPQPPGDRAAASDRPGTGAPLWRRPPRQCDGFRTSTRAGTP